MAMIVHPLASNLQFEVKSVTTTLNLVTYIHNTYTYPNIVLNFVKLVIIDFDKLSFLMKNIIPKTHFW